MKRIKKHYENWKGMSSIFKLFSTLSVLMFLTSFISLLAITFASKVYSLESDFSHEGFRAFTEIYDFPIKAFAGFLALFTIFVTLKRTQATEIQNRFNNYFQFRKEFINHFRAGYYFKLLIKYVNQNLDAEDVFSQIFHKLYGTYGDFTPMFTSNAKEQISLVKRISKDPLMKIFPSHNKESGEELIKKIYSYNYETFFLTGSNSFIFAVSVIKNYDNAKIFKDDDFQKATHICLALLCDLYFLRELNKFINLDFESWSNLEFNLVSALLAVGIEEKFIYL